MVDEARKDALTEFEAQNGLIAEMLQLWDEKTRLLQERDDVDDRWRRGSAVKLLLQHMAVREAALQDIEAKLRQVGEQSLADRIEAHGVERRRAIDRLDEESRGHQAITLNDPEVDLTVSQLEGLFREETTAVDALLVEVRRVLGSPDDRQLPSARSVRLRSDTHPRPVPRWYDRVKPLKAVVAFYSHLRSSPSGVTSPGVDDGREHMPGPDK